MRRVLTDGGRALVLTWTTPESSPIHTLSAIIELAEQPVPTVLRDGVNAEELQRLLQEHFSSVERHELQTYWEVASLD